MLQADNTEPIFVSNYIKLVARGSTCGGFTIRPKSGAGLVRLESYKYYSPIGTDTADTTDGQLGSYDNGGNGLDDGGKRFRYDWAGSGSLTHYRIYCKRKMKKNDEWTNVNCSDVVTIDNIRHNESCGTSDFITGPGVGSEGYNDLKMNQA